MTNFPKAWWLIVSHEGKRDAFLRFEHPWDEMQRYKKDGAEAEIKRFEYFLDMLTNDTYYYHPTEGKKIIPERYGRSYANL